MQSQPIKLITYNVNGLGNPVKRSKIMTKLKKEEIEVALLQETHLSQTEHEKLKKWKFKLFSSSCSKTSKRGVAILISNRLTFECVHEKKDREGRYVMIKGYLEGALTTIINVYAPPGSEWKFYKKIFELITENSEGILVLGGDLNIRLNPLLDASNSQMGGQIKTTKNIIALMKEMGLLDVWREVNPTQRDFTFFSHRHNCYSRLDYFFTFQNDLHRVVSSKIGIMDLSDHAPVYLELLYSQEKKETYWRLNTSILQSMGDQIRNDIKNYLLENDNKEVSPSILWDALKAVMRGKIIGYSSNWKKKRNEQLKSLQAQLKTLENAHKSTLSKILKSEIDKKKNEINEILTSELKRKMTFLQQSYYEAGGKSARLLAYKLKKQQLENTIHKIRDPTTNSLKCKLNDIQETFLNFYKQLYAQPKIDESLMIKFLDSMNFPKVSEAQNKCLTANITDSEIKKAISDAKPNKAPGPDGFPSEWYKEMKDLLVPVLKETFNFVFKTGIMPPSWNEASISLIAKEGKDKMECGNFRPISVLNQDYKIFTSIIAKRLENVLPEIISLDQTGFIKKRQTQDNIRRTLHIIDHTVKCQNEMVLISLDAEKAFDRVNWVFLYRVLQKFEFHSSFIKVVQALYGCPKAKIKVNGALSKSFLLERGCRQGCPTSPLFFALFIEALSQGITQTHNITGVNLLGQEHKISLFADDVLIYLSNPDSSFPNLITYLDTFSSVSGYKLNMSKTQLLSFNYNPGVFVTSRIQLNWSMECIKYLGINIPKDLSKLFDLNLKPLLQQIQSDIKRWELIPIFSFESRIDTVKMSILSRILYFFQTLPITITDNYFNKWDKLISRFIWQGKRPRVRLKTLQLSKEKGGVSLPCLKDYYISAQFRTLVCWCNPDYQARWKEIEMNLSADCPLQARLGDKKLIKNLIQQDNQWINLPLKLWLNFITKYKLWKEVKILRWAPHDLDFTPSKIDASFQTWPDRGLSAYCTFFHNENIRDFQSIMRNHQLRNTDFFRFLQVRHHINDFLPQNRKVFDIPILKILVKVYKTDSGLKLISRLHKDLQDMKKVNSEYIKQKWDRETHSIMQVDNWLRHCSFQWKITSSNMWRSFGWKSICRYFITPAQSSHYSYMSSCWRNCGAQGVKHHHLFWACPTIQPFWNQIKSVINTMLNMNTGLQWDEWLFGSLYSVKRNKDTQRLFGMLSLAARKCITKNWLKSVAPNLDEWHKTVYLIFVMERITFQKRLQMDKFTDIWEKWLSYIQTRHPEYI